jgi:Zn-finger nucleic acid-binding protein
VLQCPVCGTTMREIERFGVLVDICPSCKGVWLDRGELDKIIQYAQSGYGDEVMAAGGYEPVAYEPPTPSDPSAAIASVAHAPPDALPIRTTNTINRLLTRTKTQTALL